MPRQNLRGNKQPVIPSCTELFRTRSTSVSSWPTYAGIVHCHVQGAEGLLSESYHCFHLRSVGYIELKRSRPPISTLNGLFGFS
ncbi:hypothetical protein C8D95_113115 [Silicimonas algicola]|uniref:Uncharacterized protein n=1 Tax=Silicimonas algicola TaxID=1826607 RepID=A0A316G1B2_9RHOB|nr:hypothetical protein C8D95_113115 [Silicimonas algicola]